MAIQFAFFGMVQLGACQPVSDNGFAPVRRHMETSHFRVPERSENTSSAFDRRLLTKSEQLRLKLAIDSQLMQELAKKNRNYKPVAQIYSKLATTDFSDADIDYLATTDWNSLDPDYLENPQLGNIFKKIAKEVTKVVDAAVQVVKPVTEAVVKNFVDSHSSPIKTVKAIVEGKSLKTVFNEAIQPVKDTIDVIKKGATVPVNTFAVILFEKLDGMTSKYFLYVFIPEDAPELEQYPMVRKKRNRQVKAVNELVKECGMDREYIMKHIRNAIVSKYGKNPEDILHDFANQTETEFTFTQEELNEGVASELQVTLDAPDEPFDGNVSNPPSTDPGLGCEGVCIVIAIVTALTALISAGVALYNALQKSNTPTTNDWVKYQDGTEVNVQTGEVKTTDGYILSPNGTVVTPEGEVVTGEVTDQGTILVKDPVTGEVKKEITIPGLDPNRNVTEDPSYEASGSTEPFYKKPAGIALLGVGAVGLGLALFND